MLQVKMDREYDIDAETLWSVVSDFSNVQKVHPLVKYVDKLSDSGRGEGAIRRCNFYDGGSATEKTFEWNEEGKSYKVGLLEGSLPLKKATAHFKVKELGAGRSKLTGDFVFVVKYGLLGKIMEHLVMKPKLRPVIEKLFAGFGYHIKTGKEVEQNDTTEKLVAAL